MSDLVDMQKWRLELDEVECKLHELMIRRDALRDFLKAYDALQKAPMNGAVRNGASRILAESITPAPLFTRMGRPHTARARILEGVVALLGDRKPHRTAELLEGLQAQNIEVGGKNKQQTIARLMSGNPLFLPDRKVGWSLADPKK